MDLKKFIRDIPDFPQKGVMFRDITTILKNAQAFKYSVDAIVNKFKNAQIDKVVSIEARGYIFGGAIAYNLGCGLVPVRKLGKLPAETVKMEYELEYGKNVIEIHKDGIEKGERILLFDDVLATGGTMLAACKLVELLGGKVVACAFIANLTYLNGTEKLKDYEVFSLVEY
ncbi:MAG: adenine phosphoribosyltransferase [candidate division WOR-3 bacterium]|nr:adenine phosphoribosyltransferase [candidate division WOR-3 bacterium]